MGGLDTTRIIDGPGIVESGVYQDVDVLAHVEVKDATRQFTCSGTLKKLRFGYRPGVGNTPLFEVAIYSGAPGAGPKTGSAVAIASAQILPDIMELDLGDGVAVAEGDRVAVKPLAFGGQTLTADRFKMSSAGGAFWSDPDQDDTFTESPDPYGLIWEAEIESAQRMQLDQAAPVSGTAYDLPAYADRPGLVILRDVALGAGDTLTVDLFRRDHDNGATAYEPTDQVEIDPANNRIRLNEWNGAGYTARDVALANAAGEKLDVLIWYDVQSASWNLLWQNTTSGQGGKAGGSFDGDITTRSHAAAVLGRRMAKYRVTPVLQAAGGSEVFRCWRQVRLTLTGGTVGKIQSGCNLLVAVGDGFAASSVVNDGVRLAMVGSALQDGGHLANPHLVWLAAIPTNRMLTATADLHAGSERYGMAGVADSGSDPSTWGAVIGVHDLCELVDATFVLVNGPGFNDVLDRVGGAYDITGGDSDLKLAAASAAATVLVEQLIGWLGLIVGDGGGAFAADGDNSLASRGNRVVLCEMCYGPDVDRLRARATADAVDRINAGLHRLSYAHSLPLAKTNAELCERDLGGVHVITEVQYYNRFKDAHRAQVGAEDPGEDFASAFPLDGTAGAGTDKIADLIATAYENDQVAEAYAGDLTAAMKFLVNTRVIDANTNVVTVMDDDGVTPFATITPTEPGVGQVKQTVAIL
jgi:hypothetical protein